MKVIKYLSIIAIAFLLLLGGLVASLYFIDLNQYKGTLEKQFTELMGREISIKGDSELNVSMSPHLLLGDVHLKNAPWGSQPDMLRIGKAEVEVKLIPLLFNRVEISRLSFKDAEVLVESNEEGRSNWALGEIKGKTEKTSDSEGSGLQTEFVLHDALLENCLVSYKGYDKEAVRVTLDTLVVKHTSGDLQQWSIMAKYNDIPFSIDGTTGYIHDLLRGRPFKSDLKGKLGNSGFDVKGDFTLGKVQDIIGLNLEYSIRVQDLKDISKIAKTKLPEIGPAKVSGKVSRADGFYQFRLDGETTDIKLSSDGRISQAFDGKGDEINLMVKAPDLAQVGQLGNIELPKIGPVEVKAKLSEVKDGYKISGLDAKIAKSDIKGEVSIAYQRKPMFVQAQLSSNLLDLTPFQNQESGKTETKQKTDASKGERVFPDTPLPIDQLKKLNADINLTVKKLEVDSDTLRNVKLALKNENGRLTLNPVQAQLEGGPIEGDFVFDASKQNAKPDVTLNLHSSGLELGKFKELKDSMSGGSTKVKVHLNGSGSSISEIMASLDGDVVLDIGEAVLADGTINLIGGDMLDSLLGTLAPTEESAASASLECAVVRFDIKEGQALADKSLALKTHKTVMVGSGKINLKTEEISIQISSHSRGTVKVDAGDLTRSVGLGGTLANPKPVLDVVGAAKTGATVGAAILTLGSSYLAQKLIEASIEDSHPCQTALGTAPSAGEKEKEEKVTRPRE
jgi:uncharacterized protein involved in outer membrane biogenesis